MVAPKAETELASGSHFSQLKTPTTACPPQLPPRSNVNCATFYETSTQLLYKKSSFEAKK